ncbi:MAG TPA: Rne/Rng family ribonuclease [Terriglobia bacterium]|nr:Rne/Rng family ribonuclease [Terriglobia bacterium]
MSKELFISSFPHETKVAVLEDDNLVEVFYQRDTDVGLVGGIYKGRVSRVLPGMQSAFVDIGLERDAFLYVSDFFEDSDEYDRVVTEAEARVVKQTAAEGRPGPRAGSAPSPTAADEDTSSSPTPTPEGVRLAEPGAAAIAAEQPAVEATAPAGASAVPPASLPEPASAPAAEGQSPPAPRRWHQESRGRGRRRRRGRGFGGKDDAREYRPAEPAAAPASAFQILPGESLAKYGQATSDETPAAPAEAVPAADEDVRAEGAPGGEAAAAAVPAAGGVAVPPESSAAAAGEGAEQHPGEFSRTTEAPPYGVAAESPAGFAGPAGTASPSPEEPSDESLEAELLAGDLRMAPVRFEPDAPTHRLGSTAQAGGEEGAPGVPTAEADQASAPIDTAESVDVEETEGAAAAATGEPDEESVETAEIAGEAGEWPGTEAEGSGATEDAASTDEGATPGAATDQSPRETGDRAYTLRDAQQRPRFAPRRGRRGRGRFGPRDSRPQGGPRRNDRPRGGNEQAVQINEVLKEGQEILVQIAKEPLGTKGARITSHIALPGRYLVYMPTIRHIGVSRKIASEEERLRLRNVILEHRGVLPGGIIVRTAAAGRSDEELKADVEFLAKLWSQIRGRSEQSKAPALIHRDLTLVERILRDILSPDFKSVRTDNDVEYQNILDFVHRFQPSLVGHVKLYTKDTPMFEEFGVQAEIDKALKPKVWLKSGGYIVINQTEALVAIDVNTGKYVGKTNRLEDTIVKTNIDAVKEIVRQVRLRDLGGIIVIDFIDMDDRRNRAKVVQALEEALRADRAPTKILSFNEFGLVALTRKRVKQSLERTLSESCPYCTGSGWIKSVTTVCYEIMEEARKMAGEIEGNALTLRVSPEVAKAMKSRDGALTSEVESMTGKDVIIKSDPAVHQERFEIF